MSYDIKSDLIDLSIPDKCCTAETGCEFDGTLRRVRAEPIYTQKVYDAVLMNLQGLKTAIHQKFYPNLGPGTKILNVLDIRCRKYFNPDNWADEENLLIDPDTTISGAQFVKDESGLPVKVIGPDGLPSQKIIYGDTSYCDTRTKGTPIFGTQITKITGMVVIEIDVLYSTEGHHKKNKATLFSKLEVGTVEDPFSLTNFFELCLPSTTNSAYLPRFAEFCNLSCETRLATNNITRDIHVCPKTGFISIDLLTALCITCEKKIIVPVQLCVLSTGFPKLSAENAPICSSFPPLFPKQIDRHHHFCEEETLSEEE